MWPWEHLAIGYVAYSLAKRMTGRKPPGRWEIVVLAIGTQFPDLIDKPIGWGTTLLPGGVSLAHSYLFAVPFVAIVHVCASALKKPRLGVAFGVGYLLHTPADVVARYLLDGHLFLGAFVWPLVPVPAISPQPLFGRASDLFESYLDVLATPAGLIYLGLEVVLLSAALFAWLADRRTKRTQIPVSEPAD